MKLYILLSAPVIGAIEATTIKERILLCEHCNRKELHFSNAILNLDKWNGEEMISAMGQLFISENLKIKLDTLNILFDATPFDVLVKKKSIKDQKPTPNFYRILFRNVCKGQGEPWFEFISKCDTCGREKWMMDTEGYRSSANPELTGKDIENPAPRKVDKASWKNEDVFLLQDEYDIPIVTQNFVDILEELGIKINKKGGVWLRQTNWIE